MSSVLADGWAAQVLDRLREQLGAKQVLTGGATAPFACDIFASGAALLAVLQPRSVEALQGAVAIAHGAGLAMAIRGGGASYTHGYLASRAGTVLFDLRGLARIVEINVQDAYVTVECGVTWQALQQALAAQGVRTPFRGPFSGLVATVGGTVAQHGISHGTGRYGGAAQSVLGLDVVLADGRLLSTGSGATGQVSANRYFGPDLSGLFTGDCAAFGIKARITLPLLPATVQHAGVSYAFSSFEALHQGLQAAARAGADDTHFALDAALLRGQLARGRSLRETADIALGVLRTSPSLLSAFGQLARMALAGERALKQAPYLAHFMVEEQDRHSLKAAVLRLRRSIGGLGVEIANTVPTVIHSAPFAKLFNILGPRSERWVPVHGVLANSRVAAFHQALQDLYAHQRLAMARHGVWTGAMYESVGAGCLMYEVGIYWPDELSDYHQATLTDKQKLRAGAPQGNPAARAWVEGFKAELVALFDAHGATHYQIGTVYPYLERMGATAVELVQGVKDLLDPQGRMSPGVLGLP